MIKNARRTAHIVSASSNYFLELDFWFPDLRLAFEFQVTLLFPSLLCPVSSSFSLSQMIFLTLLSLRTHTTTCRVGLQTLPMSSRSEMISLIYMHSFSPSHSLLFYFGAIWLLFYDSIVNFLLQSYTRKRQPWSRGGRPWSLFRVGGTARQTGEFLSLIFDLIYQFSLSSFFYI